MPRPIWKGHLRLALVTCPIELTPALTTRDQVHFHKLNRETGNRLRMQMIDAGTEEVAPPAAWRRRDWRHRRSCRRGRDFRCLGSLKGITQTGKVVFSTHIF